MTCSNSSSGTMARNIGSLSGGAGPSWPSAPWQPAQWVAYRAPKSVTWSAGTGRSAGLGRPGRSQPLARSSDKVTRAKSQIRNPKPQPFRAFGLGIRDLGFRIWDFEFGILVTLSPCHQRRAASRGRDVDHLRTEHYHLGGHAEHELGVDAPDPRTSL